MMVQAQLNIGTTGGDFSNSEGSISYTIGQTMTNYLENVPQAINEGVQQPYEYFSLATSDIAQTLPIEFFPNPTTGIVFLKGEQLIGAEIQLIDVNGKLIEIRTMDEMQTSFDLSQLPTGVYTLQVLNSQLSNAIRIIKH